MAGKEKEKGVTRWDPFADLGFPEWRMDFPRLGGLRRWLEEGFGEPGGRAGVLSPAVDITENDEAYTIRAEVPGVKKDDLALEVREGVLTLRGEKKVEREEGKDRGRRLERSFGAFSRSFALPSDANVDRVDASFKDGVLCIVIPKQPEAKPMQVSIKG
jgi:HSP20 family protein